MYQDYWQLNAKPFEPACDEAFYYMCPPHQSAMHKLRYAVESRRPAAVLAGPAGVGKTQLVEQLGGQLDGNVFPVVQVVFPQMSDRDLLAYLADQLGAPPVDPPRRTIDESIRRIEQSLAQNLQCGRHPVVVVDEAHLLEDAGLFEPLRLLLNLKHQGQSMFTLLLVGQTELLPAVARYGSLDERIDIKVSLTALDDEQTCQYVEHRLAAAGATREIFAADGLLLIHQLTGGLPRRINRLCDLALLVGFAAERTEIDAEGLQSVSDELVTMTQAA